MVNLGLYYDKNGSPLDSQAYFDLFKDTDYSRIAWDTDGDTSISTVWLGITHGQDHAGRPLIFESVVISEGDNGDSRYSEHKRYATVEEALAGHKALKREHLSVHGNRFKLIDF